MSYLVLLPSAYTKKKMLYNKFSVLVVILKCLSAVVVTVQPLKIISIVSNSSDADTPLWGRGEELIPGALLAAQEVNSNEDVLNGFHIEVVPLFVQDCSVSEGILKTVQELLSTDYPVIGVTGLFCPRLMKVLSSLLSHKEINIVQLPGATIVDLEIAEYQNSHTVTIPEIQTQIEALFNLLGILNWNNFNLVSIRSRTRLKDYYTDIERAIVRRATMDSNWLVHEARIDSSLENLLEMLRWSTSPIIIAVLPPETAADLLCYAYKNKMTWPRYGWIMLDLTVSESAQCGGESLLRAMENVIVLKFKLEQNNNLTLLSNLTYSNYVQRLNQQHSSSTIPHNLYTNVLYDSVWALALAVNSSLQTLQHSNLTLTAKTEFGTLDKEAVEILKESLLETTFTGASGEFKHGNIQSSVEIYQIRNESFITLGNRHDNVTLIQLDLLGETRPQDEIPRVYQHIPDAITITVSVGISLAVVFVTVVLVAFFCSWRQPEVRASSRVLSLCIFLGSYLLLISSITDNIFASVYVDPVGVPVCIIIPALAHVGLDLILATVLAKTLRIAYIFTKFKKNIGNNCSDYVLFAMIALIVGGKAFLLIAWNAIDVNHIEDIPNPVLTLNDDGFPQYNVFQQCYSQYQLVRVSLMAVYTLLICLALAVVSYVTRKIRMPNYKDTKKINAFLFTALIITLLTIALWWIFRFLRLYQISTTATSIGYTSAPILCQVFLIIPKIGPGLKRSCTYGNSNIHPK